MKNTVATFLAAKGREKLTMLTAYDYSIARIIDQCGINAILVGDSLGMVCLGYRDTLPVTMEDMVRHCAAVARGTSKALLVCDMPFMSFQCGCGETLRSAARLVKEGGANAVKLEGGAEYAAEIRALTRATIPVMGHIGLTPQAVNSLGGYKVQGNSPRAAQKLLDDARAIEEAGAFALVLECVPWRLAAKISASLAIPVIGIGAGPACDGQVLVWQDMLGVYSDHSPRFVRRFAEIGKEMAAAFSAYAQAVRAGEFPAPEHCYESEEP